MQPLVSAYPVCLPFNECEYPPPVSTHPLMIVSAYSLMIVSTYPVCLLSDECECLHPVSAYLLMI